MAGFSYFILVLNKILSLFYQAWGAKTTCRGWKGGDGIKKFEKHYFRPNRIVHLSPVCIHFCRRSDLLVCQPRKCWDLFGHLRRVATEENSGEVPQILLCP